MAKYKNILFAADLSASTDEIAKVASEIATRNNAKISILHVLEYTPIVHGGGEYTVPLDINLEERLAEAARKALSSLSNRLKISEKDQYISRGSTKEEILSLAHKIKADLIVVGTHGRHGLQLLLGSTANSVLHGAKCDVLAVRIKK